MSLKVTKDHQRSPKFDFWALTGIFSQQRWHPMTFDDIWWHKIKFLNRWPAFFTHWDHLMSPKATKCHQMPPKFEILSADRLPGTKLDRFLTEIDHFFRVRWNARENHQKHEFLTRISRILTDCWWASLPRLLRAINDGYRQPGLRRRKTPPQHPAPVAGSATSNPKYLCQRTVTKCPWWGCF